MSPVHQIVGCRRRLENGHALALAYVWAAVSGHSHKATVWYFPCRAVQRFNGVGDALDVLNRACAGLVECWKGLRDGRTTSFDDSFSNLVCPESLRDEIAPEPLAYNLVFPSTSPPDVYIATLLSESALWVSRRRLA